MIGDNIRKIRMAKGLSMSGLAKSISVSVGYLSDIEKGHKNNPSVNFLNKIAEALEVPLDYLMRTSATAIIEDKIIELGLTYEHVAKKSGVSLNFINNINNITNPDESDLNNLIKIANVLNIDPKIIGTALSKQMAPAYEPKVSSIPSKDFEPVGSDIETFKIDASKFINIPIVGSIRAGEPIIAQDNIEGYNLVPKDILSTDKQYFYLKVKGDSMNLEFNEGSLLLVEKVSWVENGCIAVVLIDNTEATVKKVIQNGNMITLIPMSNNPVYTPTMYDVIKDNITIIGRVKQAIKNY